ncbi:DUF4129 domain-containing protein [Halospeciosus flavus]|uniref:DUF4129 domain-containing protein n=1 Tax=Halospeciosus flavus TaxID=3032283 RepID=A0ABD5Z5W5_9EURY|nr:DUF4129 domain-containing protein [Halospeciosus flavus]
MSRYRPLIVALVCVLALSLAAATVTNPVSTGGGPGLGTGDGGVGSGGEFGVDTGNRSDRGVGGAGGFDPIDICLPILTSTWFGLGAVLVLVVTWVLLARRVGGFVATAVLLPVVLVGLLVHALLTNCGSSLDLSRPGSAFDLPNQTGLPGGGGGLGEGTATAATVPTVLLFLAAVAIVGLGVVLVRASADDTAEGEEPEPDVEPESEADLGAVGSAAGDAADRIEASAGVENEVFRAWREMTDHLDVRNPRSTTPAEFADAAREAGMDEAHVAELTDLFREVRYGDADPSPEREERALDALRAIEAAYGDAGSEAADGPADDESDANGGVR